MQRRKLGLIVYWLNTKYNQKKIYFEKAILEDVCILLSFVNF